MDVFAQAKQNVLPPPKYSYITDEDSARRAMEKLSKYPILQIDTETTDLDPYSAKWSLLQIGAAGHSYVFDVRYDTEFSSVNPKILLPLLTNPNILKILQNANFDMKIIKKNTGVYLNNVYDTMLSEQLLNLGRLSVKTSLAALADRYTGIELDKEPRNTFKDYNQEFQPYQIEYAANDVVLLELIRDLQLPKIKKEGLENACRLEFDFLIPLCEMELNGIKIDVDKWNVIMKDVDKERLEVKKIILDMLGECTSQTTLFGVSLINIDSNDQLKKALKKFGLNLENTSAGELAKFTGVPIVDAILDYRKASKLISTYADSLLAKIHPATGRLHTDFRQMVSTGRLSSSDPNLQNIPGKQKFRSCFIAPEGYSLLTADMSGAELRILGNLSKDPVFIEAYSTGQDLHTRTASEMFNVSYEEAKQKRYRGAAKAINFGLCTPEDTNIITNYGVKEISGVNIGDITAHDFGSDLIIDKAFMGEKEVFELKTKYGYSIELTSEHLVKVINKSGEYVDKPLCALDYNNDLVCLKCGSKLFSTKEVYFNTVDVDKKTNYKHFNLPSKLTKDWAAFLGLFVSEGSVFKAKNRENYSTVSFGFSKENGEFIHKTDSLFNELFGDRVSKSDNKYKRYTINSVLFAEWLVSILEIDGENKTDVVRVPKCIKTASKDLQIEFLRWLFEGDGTVKKNGEGYKISYSSNSIKLLKDIQIILLNLGIISSITEEVRKGYDKIYYALSLISVESCEEFKKSIGFLTKYKMDKCFSNAIYNTSAYFINNHKERIDSIIKNNNVSKQLKERFYKSRLDDNIGNIYLEELSKYDDFFKFIYENNIVPLPIKFIKSMGIKKVYDLSVENHQYFLANGFVVHNCYGMSPIGLSKRLDISENEAKQLINIYFQKYSGVKRYLEQSGHDAVMNRYSTTASGRRRYYNMPPFEHPDRKKIQRSIERQGKNAGIQGCLCFDSKIKGLGNIGGCVGKRVGIETGFGKDNAAGVYSGNKEVYDLKLSNGISLGITLDHKLPVVNDYTDGEYFEDVAVKDLNKNHYIMIPLNVVEGRVTDLSGYKYTKGHWRETFVDFKYPNVMSDKLAFVIGCLLGDGSYTKHNHFRFVCPEYQIEAMEKFNAYVKELFGYTPVIRKLIRSGRSTTLYTSQVSSVVIRGFLKHIGLDYVKHREKKIPEYFFTETIENRGALLNGLFSTDGGMTKNSGPNFTNSSKNIANGVHQLLFSLGINSNLKEYTEGGEQVFRLNIPKRFTNEFKKYVGFSVIKKQNDLIKHGSTPKFGDDSVVPEFIPRTIEGVLRKNPNYFKEFSSNEKAHLRRFKLGKCSFTSWRKFYKRMPDCQEKRFLSKYLNYDFCKFKSLSFRGNEDTYDLMCDNIHYFTANGVIVHNSNADTIKEAMILLVERLKPYDARLILTVHDEVVVEVNNEQREEVAPVVSQALVDGFGKYFHLIPMKTDTLVGPCWLKGACEDSKVGNQTISGCGSTHMKFIHSKKYGTKLVCANCGKDMEL